MQYQIYFHFPSKSEFLSIHEAPVTDKLDSLYELVGRLALLDDLVSIYLPEDTCRIQIALIESEKFIVSLDDPSRAGTTSKVVDGNDSASALDAVNEIATDRQAAGWGFEYW